MIYHLTERAVWDAAVSDGGYRMSTRGVSLAEQGFVHCSLLHQVRTVAEFLYPDVDDLLLLVVDEARVGAPVRYEGGFPHVYGPLPLDAVVEIVAVDRGEDGQFVLPTA